MEMDAKYISDFLKDAINTDPLQFLIFFKGLLEAYLLSIIKRGPFFDLIVNLFVVDDIVNKLEKAGFDDLREIISIEHWSLERNFPIVRKYISSINRYLVSKDEAKFQTDLKAICRLISKEMENSINLD